MQQNNNQKNGRILVIDDNPAIHQDFRKILEGKSESAKNLAEAGASIFGNSSSNLTLAEFQIDSAFQGQEGLERVRQSLANNRPYAMAFIDVRMPPGWDGIETIAQIWKVCPDLQVVICTAFSDYSWDEMIAKVGRSDRLVILKKPFDNIEVAQLAQALTHKWELLQEAKRKFDNLEQLIRERTAELVSVNQRLLEQISEREQAESERQTMEVQLRQAHKLEAVGQLAAGIAHEINTPAQYVGDNIRFLKESFASLQKVVGCHKQLIAAAKNGPLPPDRLAQAEHGLRDLDIDYLQQQIPVAIEETLEGVERISKIVRAMKEFSHPGGREKTSADLNQAIGTTVTVARNEWRYVADVKLELSPDLPLVPCYLGEINQCVLNLLVNAAHAIKDALKQTPDAKGLITVRTSKDGDYVEVRVTDTGTGIPESARPHIFEPFFTTKGVGKGTGQGLSIVYGTIVKKHEGSVRFETETGRGTSFILRLPINPIKISSGSPTEPTTVSVEDRDKFSPAPVSHESA